MRTGRACRRKPESRALYSYHRRWATVCRNQDAARKTIESLNCMTTNSGSIPATSSSQPDVAALQAEYQYAWNQDPDASTRLARREDIRYNRWPGQSWDGLKHQELLPEGQRALPYDRAPDTRVNLADSIIQDLVDRDYLSFWNARAKAAPIGTSRPSAGQAGELRQVISWMLHGPLRAKLIRDVEFASQVLHEAGWVVLHPTWRKENRMRLQRLTLESILQIAQQAPPETVLQELPGLIMQPET